jgi:hypothetical protein
MCMYGVLEFSHGQCRRSNALQKVELCGVGGVEVRVRVWPRFAGSSCGTRGPHSLTPALDAWLHDRLLLPSSATLSRDSQQRCIFAWLIY